MNKIVTSAIIILCVLSLLTIFCVEFEFQLIKINAARITCLKINRICLNLSYGYCASFIMYVLTVYIPQFQRKKIYKPLLVSIIDDYYYRSMFQYFLYCTDKNSNIPFAKDDKYLKNYCGKMDQKFGKENIMNGQLSTKSFVKRADILKTLSEVNRSFNHSIIPYEEYLTDKQKIIARDIRLEHSLDFYFHYHETKFREEDYFELNIPLYEAAKSLVKFIDEIHTCVVK